MIARNLKLYDCTLREGEQAAGASFSLNERLELVELLDDFGFDYIELGWPVVSGDMLEAFKIAKQKVKNSKIVAFGSTCKKEFKDNPGEDPNLGSIIKSQVNYACIFGKTSLEHVDKQLRLTKEENIELISHSIKFLREKGLVVFYDAEHYFDGFIEDDNYAIETLIVASKAGAERLILCETKGGMLTSKVREIVKETRRRLDENKINTELGVHFHNDSGLALANTLESLPFIEQVQGTINGIGERVGNLNFSEFLPIYILKMGNKLNVKLNKLKEINEKAFRLAGITIPEQRPFVGDSAFSHKGGVHTDAMSKGASYEHMNPALVGNESDILLNTFGGTSCVMMVAKELGYNLDKKDNEVHKKIERLFIELGEMERKGYRISAVKAEQFLLIEKYFGSLKEFFEIEKWNVFTGMENGKEETEFYVKAKLNGNSVEEKYKVAGGPVDAAYKTLLYLLTKKYPDIKNLELVDFHVSIAKSKKEESSVRTEIEFQDKVSLHNFHTVGVDSNILQSSFEAIVKGFRYYLNQKQKEKAI